MFHLSSNTRIPKRRLLIVHAEDVASYDIVVSVRTILEQMLSKSDGILCSVILRATEFIIAIFRKQCSKRHFISAGESTPLLSRLKSTLRLSFLFFELVDAALEA